MRGRKERERESWRYVGGSRREGRGGELCGAGGERVSAGGLRVLLTEDW